PGLAPLLALALTWSTRSLPTQCRGARPDRHDGAGQSSLGQRAHSRRVAQAGAGGLQALDPALPTAWACPSSQPDLAHVLEQPRPPRLGSRPAHSTHADVQDLV